MPAKVSREDFSCAAPTNASAYRQVNVPVLCVDAGAGPSVALMAGVHGDEWEGQAAVLDLWHRLPGMLQRGKVYLLPAANAEASMAATRLSPSDGGNLNRAFLGHPVRGYTEAVAAALEARVLSKVQVLVDVHSGGASLRYLPGSVVTRYQDAPWNPLLGELAAAFGLPHCFYFHSGETGSMPAAAHRHGVARLSAEIGGGGETTHALVQACRDGMLGCLAVLGMVDPPPRGRGAALEPAVYDLSQPCATLRTQDRGVFVPQVSLGGAVQAGDTLGALIRPTQPEHGAREIAAPQAGVVVCLRALADSQPGDCLAQVAPAASFASLAERFQ
ncbi:succinylglutamate desuccinylase/aspartoacylase domain-containing protein [Bordetella genomosp. 13]|uniref:Succinylglutamate desuccinylase n=1 Tax=Bordetella genomosp. 13 TaxID=463040 RepID=A0A1W6ZEY4_9BORD|nr:succinylglutamate desuccinylase/aspartoacylase family protein [Bordetella genomosp. 13]ARP95953.1 succinylglutamate desuccinylase [Bordetella genomosp. 13]